MSGIGAENREQREYLYDLLSKACRILRFSSITADTSSRGMRGGHRLLGYAGDEIKGKHLSIFYTEEKCADGVVEQELCTAKEKSTASDDRWSVRKDGRRAG
jgi:hypothetical protein